MVVSGGGMSNVRRIALLPSPESRRWRIVKPAEAECGVNCKLSPTEQHYPRMAMTFKVVRVTQLLILFLSIIIT